MQFKDPLSAANGTIGPTPTSATPGTAAGYPPSPAVVEPPAVAQVRKRDGGRGQVITKAAKDAAAARGEKL